ncbi:filamin-A-like [Tamandua tetradactyla]|uniref:filamin-A-like n=1 Tax=Tamandua tetradactyla TaxID=48850 RepID=UPI004053F870
MHSSEASPSLNPLQSAPFPCPDTVTLSPNRLRRRGALGWGPVLSSVAVVPSALLGGRGTPVMGGAPSRSLEPSVGAPSRPSLTLWRPPVPPALCMWGGLGGPSPADAAPPVPADSKAIVDGNLKLILGLVWTLILHYSISMPMWDEEEDEEAKKQTPKQRLLGWIQNKLPQLPITNFSRDWQSGRALGALVDSCAPGLCPDWDSWDASKPVNNDREAMQQADDWLGILSGRHR